MAARILSSQAQLEADRRHMRHALRLAERGRGHTAPNPVVGAVIVRAGKVVGEGWHRAVGRDHAEVEALAQAGGKARGATLYVTLEPCAHWGRTPPCADALLNAGIARCVVAARDPDARVRGRGLRRLRAAGVRVEVGLLAELARAQLVAYRCVHEHGVPRITWKVAATLDGRLADAVGRSQWITGTAARADGHRLRAMADAIVVGAGTARADDPRLTARTSGRTRGGGQPLRVVVDSRLRLPRTLRLFAPELAHGTVVACTAAAPLSRERWLAARGVRVWRLPAQRGRVAPKALAARLVAESRHEVLLEGGATLGSAFLRAGLVRHLVLYLAPLVLGGGRAWCDGLDRRLADTARGRLASFTRLGDDVRVDMEVED
jgi:diaminohydroxyphosphoribosylaminopyrimidine deaminase/5-amino-6-(5-phosphoribosylamino)uracil reductase